MPAVRAAGKNEVINLLTYEGYIPDSVTAAFTEETGIKINLTPISSNEELYEKLKSSPDLYDLVIASYYMLDTMIAEDMLLALDKSKLENFGNLNSEYQGQYYDPGDEYTIPYAAGRPLIVYDPGEGLDGPHLLRRSVGRVAGRFAGHD